MDKAPLLVHHGEQLVVHVLYDQKPIHWDKNLDCPEPPHKPPTITRAILPPSHPLIPHNKPVAETSRFGGSVPNPLNFVGGMH